MAKVIPAFDGHQRLGSKHFCILTCRCCSESYSINYPGDHRYHAEAQAVLKHCKKCKGT